MVPPTSNALQILGSDRFIRQVESALRLLAERAPQKLIYVQEGIAVIRHVQAGSGINVYSKTYSIGEGTAFAEGYAVEQQVVWLAGTIVHDACHSHLYAEGRAFAGKDPEIECMVRQREALALIDTDTSFSDYLGELISSADDPDSQYWNNPDRHW